MRKLFFLLILACCTPLLAQDYVDLINQSASAPTDRRVIYEMNVGSFTAEGTLQAAQARLDELKTLGIDIVWLMPIYPRGGGINSPYAPKNFQQVNPAYGTVADLKAFVARAHALGMKVWLDWVPNHTATDADWVTTHPDYYVNVGGSFVHPNGYNDVYQLNYYSTALQEAMNNCLKFWIDQADIDGYRCDFVSSSYIPASYWQSAIPLIKGYKAGKDITFLAEADIANDAKQQASVGFDYDYAWKFQTNLLDFGTAGNTSARLKAFANTLFNESKSASFARMVYLTNHDQNYNEAKQTLTQKYGTNRYVLSVYAYLLYGMPMLYNGQEVGGNQVLNYFTDTKVNWAAADAKMRNTLRTLTALRHSQAALADRVEVNWVTVTNNNSVLAFTRKQGDSEVLVVLNLSASAANATLTGLTAGTWSRWLDSSTIAQGVSRSSASFTATQTFSLDAKGYQVYVRGSFSDEALPAPEVYTPTLDSADEVSIFFETPNEDAYAAWVWGDLGGGEAYCANPSWPGDALTYMGQTAEGRFVYKYTVTRTQEAPAWLIISRNNGNNKIYDGVAFVNHGYYVEGQSDPTQVITATTGIDSPTTDAFSRDDAFYTLSGVRVAAPTAKGIYIHHGRKIVVR